MGNEGLVMGLMSEQMGREGSRADSGEESSRLAGGSAEGVTHKERQGREDSDHVNVAKAGALPCPYCIPPGK